MPISKALTTALIDGTGAITPANVTVSTNNLTVGTALYVANNGNIGVGVTPNYKLDVNGNMAVNTNLIVGSYNLNDVGIRGYSNNSIGVFGGSNSSHGVYGQTSTGYGVIAYSNSTGTCILAQNDTSGIATYVLANTGTGAHIHSKTGNPLFVGNVGSTFVSVTANGNIGMGLNNPSHKLDVTGTFRTTSLSRLGMNVGYYNINSSSTDLTAANTSAVQICGTGGDGLYIGQYANPISAVWIQASYYNPTLATYPIVLNPLGGFVGIGASSPQRKLHVTATGTGYPARLQTTDDTLCLLDFKGNTTTDYYVLCGADGNNFVVRTAAVERIRVGTAGVQSIQFDPNQVANTNANTLDDYEEGTWTPTLECSTTNPTLTYSQQSGNYTKIGRVVVLKFDIRWSGMTNVGSGNLWIGGLPFTTHANYDAGVISEKYSVSFPSGTYTCHIETFATTTKLYLTAHPITTGPSTVLTSAQLITGQSGYLIGGITYIV